MSLLAAGFTADETDQDKREHEERMRRGREALISFIHWYAARIPCLQVDALIILLCVSVPLLIVCYLLPDAWYTESALICYKWGVPGTWGFFVLLKALRWLAVELVDYREHTPESLCDCKDCENERRTEEADGTTDGRDSSGFVPELKEQRISKLFTVRQRKQKTG